MPPKPRVEFPRDDEALRWTTASGGDEDSASRDRGARRYAAEKNKIEKMVQNQRLQS